MSRTYYQLSWINWEIHKTLDLLVNFANLKSEDPGRIFFADFSVHFKLYTYRSVGQQIRVRGNIENAFVYVDILIIVWIRHLLIMEVTWACICPRNKMFNYYLVCYKYFACSCIAWSLITIHVPFISSRSLKSRFKRKVECVN